MAVTMVRPKRSPTLSQAWPRPALIPGPWSFPLLSRRTWDDRRPTGGLCGGASRLPGLRPRDPQDRAFTAIGQALLGDPRDPLVPKPCWGAPGLARAVLGEPEGPCGQSLASPRQQPRSPCESFHQVGHLSQATSLGVERRSPGPAESWV